MNKFLDRLKLIHKVNIVFYISILLVVFLILTFFVSTTMIINNLTLSSSSYKEVSSYNIKINENLKLLDNITIQNSLVPNEYYSVQSNIAYKTIINNLTFLKRHEFFSNDKKSLEHIEKIKTRIKGYKVILDSFEDEVKDSYEDGMYAVLALSTTSGIIFEELNSLSDAIKKIANKKTEDIVETVHNIRLVVISIVFLSFLFMMYMNRAVVKSILSQLENLKEGIESFFDYLSKKREDTIHLTFNSQDEISQIAKMIDSNIYVAEKLLFSEREETVKIEKKVREVTSEILDLNNELENTQREIVFTMGAVAEKRSKETGKHVKRVAEYSFILARLYGMGLEEALLLKNASPMHDIGKIGIPDNILNKPGKLTNEEFDTMKTHAEIGYDMLKHSEKSILKVAAIVSYEHHEKWNGRGYPRGLKGDDIHIYGRITAVADVFDALGSDRVYKKAWSIEKILKLFEEERGEHFDPEIVDIFLDNLEHFLGAKERIDANEMDLRKYIEDFEKVDDIISF